MTDEIPSPARILVTGPPGSGKSAYVANALREYVATHESDGVVVLDFSPGLEGDDSRLDRRMDLPPGAWTAIVDTGSPRSGDLDAEAKERIAAENARLARMIIEDVPTDADAIFVNDVTVPFLAPSAQLDTLLDRIDDADHVVLSAHDETSELPDALTAQARDLLAQLDEWAEVVVQRGL